jgi:hypothetical protein
VAPNRACSRQAVAYTKACLQFGRAREISKSGTKDLPMGMESIMGYTIINAESLDVAEKIARNNPYIASIRVYEILTK